MIHINKKIIAVVPVLLLAIAGTGQTVKAWDGEGGGFHHWGWFHHFGGCCQQEQGCCNVGGIADGYQAGISDAVYDHDNGLAYNNVAQCCHDEDWNNQFSQGYDHKWNSFQAQDSTQRSNIYVTNSPGAHVSVNQNSDQQQNPLQQLAHTLCGVINCQGQTQEQSDNQ